MKSTRTKIKVTILNEPFSYPLMPFGIYEINEDGVPIRELGRFKTYKEAVKVIKREGWIY